MSDDDTAFVVMFAFLVIIIILGITGGYFYGKVAGKEEVCKSYFHGEPVSDGSICLRDGKVVARF